MSKTPVRSNCVANQELELLCFREPPLFAPRKQHDTVETNNEIPTASWFQCNVVDLGLEGAEQFLCDPRSAQKKTTLHAIFNFDARCAVAVYHKCPTRSAPLIRCGGKLLRVPDNARSIAYSDAFRER